MVVDIALGIVLAVIILAVGIGVLFAFVKWFLEIFTLIAMFGSLWALSKYFGGWGFALWFVIAICVLVAIEYQDSRAKVEKKIREMKLAEEKSLAELKERERWEREQREQDARIEAWKAREERKQKDLEDQRMARAEKAKADREMCIEALREGRDVIGIDGRKKTLKDFGIDE